MQKQYFIIHKKIRNLFKQELLISDDTLYLVIITLNIKCLNYIMFFQITNGQPITIIFIYLYL